MKILKFMLLFVPISFIGKFLNFSPTIMFILAALSIIPLAGIMGEGTEEISSYTGPKIGGFLNATFGNATELIISFFALKSGLFEVVKSSIAGSIIGNILLVLGASMFIGGLKHKTQNFNINVVETTSSMLLFSLIGLCVPAFFTHTINPNLLNTRYEGLSLVLTMASMLTGYLDDASKNPWGEFKKGALDLLIACLVAGTYLAFNGSEIFINVLGESISLNPIVFFILAVILVWVSINVTNCTDGVDGLSGTLSVITLFTIYLLESVKGTNSAKFNDILSRIKSTSITKTRRS